MARITKTLQLVEGQDDDLIAWFARLPDGTGQRAFKDALRKGIAGNGGNHTPVPVAPPDDTLSAMLLEIKNLPQALSLALVPVLMQIASAPGAMPPPSANYVPAYEPPERAYQAKRPPKRKAEAIVEAIQETTAGAEDALANATAAFVGMFG